MHSFRKRFRSSANPCASGVSVALRTSRLMAATDSGGRAASRRAISIARSSALPLTLSWTRPSLAASFGLTASPMRMCMSAAGPGDESQVGLRQSDQVVAILGDAEIAGKRELECAGQTCSGNGGDYWFWHALAERHGLVEKSCVVSRVVGPLAAGSAEGLGELQERGDTKVASEIPGRAARQNHGPNIGIPGITIQRRS